MAKKNNIPQKQRKNYLQYLIPGLIIIATLIVFNPTMNNGFLLGWDDTEYLTHEDIQKFNTGKIFSDYHLGMYQPVAVLSLALNYASAGESPGAYHATNLFLHIVNVFLLWLLILGLTKKRLIAGITAFLFAMHPMNVEPVAWISARSTVLFTTFYLAGLITYIRYLDGKKSLHYIYTLLFALAALFTKSLAISFPLVLLVIDYFKQRKISRAIILDKIPFLLFSALFGIIAVDAAATYGHITGLEYEYSLIDRFFILCHTYVFYLVKFVVPLRLSSIYAFPELSNGALPLWYYLSALLPAAMLAILYLYRKKQRSLIAGILFFSLAVAPVLPLFWSRIFVAADRYAYLSFIGLMLAGAILAERLISKDKIKRKAVRISGATLLIAWGIMLMYLTNIQSRYWVDSDVLLGRAAFLSKTGPEKALAHFYHGNVQQGIAENKYSQGQINGNEGMIKNSFIYYRLAVSSYDSVLKYNPDYMMAYSNRGMIFGTLYSYDSKYWDMAKYDFDKAISLAPDYADNYYNKGWLLFVKGLKEEACEHWLKADSLGSVVAGQAIEQNCR